MGIQPVGAILTVVGLLLALLSGPTSVHLDRVDVQIRLDWRGVYMALDPIFLIYTSSFFAQDSEGYGGMVLWNTVLVTDKCREGIGRHIIEHERNHVRQLRVLGPLFMVLGDAYGIGLVNLQGCAMYVDGKLDPVLAARNPLTQWVPPPAAPWLWPLFAVPLMTWF